MNNLNNQHNLSLAQADEAIFDLLEKEKKRQQDGVELIASENYCSQAVMMAQGSVATNKYAEGYPQKRYYDGCQFIDEIETLAINRAKELFKAEFANVQPHSGSSANMAVYLSSLSPGDTFLGMNLGQGGHLTHGSPVNFSGKLYRAVHYGLDPKTELIDYNQIEDLAKKEKPKMIIAGASSYSRIIDFKTISEIAKKYQSLFLVDMAHIAGLVAAELHPSPIPYADFVTSTTHKTLRGPRSGIILGKAEFEKQINSMIFPGIQGGPLEHVIAAKAVAFKEALQPSFKTYQAQVIKNAKSLASSLMNEGIELVSGGTDNHLILVKTVNLNLTGKEASTLLESVHITCNKNMIPNDTKSPFVTSGVRIGTPAVTTRGFKENEMGILATNIIKILKNPADQNIHAKVKKEIIELCQKFPIY